ncbi:hypothetical protein J1N35_019569 [Gossypium stocksii]|uniref:Uncharacterized protein n=1 Tax=Gossypium stocksii TaxID=47602 RepID=A0A9D3VS90_9ROSI|nr:hypothetical protein J1N35_019569 [Gossypium stocksii]
MAVSCQAELVFALINRQRVNPQQFTGKRLEENSTLHCKVLRQVAGPNRHLQLPAVSPILAVLLSPFT